MKKKEEMEPTPKAMPADVAVRAFEEELRLNGVFMSEERQARCREWIEAWAPDMGAWMMMQYILGIVENAARAQDGKEAFDVPTWGLKYAKARRERERKAREARLERLPPDSRIHELEKSKPDWKITGRVFTSNGPSGGIYCTNKRNTMRRKKQAG